jgi:diguanylate cyclase (GGDEF)-like protein
MKGTSAMIPYQERARRFKQNAQHDELTGLPNRVLFADRLRKAIAQAKRWGQLLAVVCLNVDGLGAVNDLHGSKTGDQVLASLARGMRRTLRKGDTLSRLEGNEFVAVLPALEDAQSSVPALKRLLEAVAQLVQAEEATIQLSASIGVAFYPQEEDADGDKLLRQASQAMHQARAAGKSHYQFFDSTQPDRAGEQPESLERIRQAHAAHEFVLHYQPKVNMSTGQVVGVEALIRWQHPQRGLSPPEEFLPAIEDHLLAVEVDEWVIDAALAQMEEWLDAGLDIPVSVNVGVLPLQQPGFADRLAALLAGHPRIQPSRLELEILDTGALQDVDSLSRLLIQCCEIGVNLALDDFGAGHFSISDLKRLPIHVLKIDPSFVRDILESPQELTILEGVLGLIKAFRRQPFAEGVETVEQGVMLLRLGCELAQGYGIAQPMRADEFPGWVAAWRPDARWSEALSVSVDERPLLFAGVEHRAWAAAIEAFLRGESEVEPRLSRHQCQFGAWLYADGPAGRSSLPAFQPIVALHWRIHALAAGIMKFRTQGRNDEGLARFGELKEQVDKLADLLNEFGKKEEEGAMQAVQAMEN